LDPDPAAPVEPPRVRATRANPNNLPLQLTSFVGRSRELSELGRVLERNRLVTITGPGGCGKTRLAVEAAAGALQRHPGGVWLVDLAAIGEAGLIPEAIGNAAGLDRPRSMDPDAGLAAAIGDRQMLLVLDNCEHLIEGCARLAEVLLRS